MRVGSVKVGGFYNFNGETVKVVKRNKNSYTEKWSIGFGGKCQRIHHQLETTFLLDNGEEVYGRQLEPLLGIQELTISLN